MSTWITAFWAGCALMACWSFSFLVRLISERIARKRTQLLNQYSKRATLIAFWLMILCGGVSVWCGYLAVDLYEDFNQGSNPLVNGATVMGWTIGVFGVFLIIWWAIGDRARGRLRCPKCWYDMSAAVDGGAGLRCPECGKVAKDATKHGKPFRARWMAVLALVFMGSGWYGVLAGPRVAETEEWLAAIPTWVLMAGWEVLPEDWIHLQAASKRGYDARLSERINRRWVSDVRLRRFGKRLCEPMLKSSEARWDQKRLALLKEFRERMLYTGQMFTSEGVWHDPPVDPERLLYLACGDLIDAIEAYDANPNAPNLVLDNVEIGSPLWIARYWISSRIHEAKYQQELGMYPRFGSRELPDTIYRASLEPLRERASTPAFGRALLRDTFGFTCSNTVWMIASSLDLFEVHLDALMDLEHKPGLMPPTSVYAHFASFSTDLPVERLDFVFERCSEWLHSQDAQSRASALITIAAFQRSHLLDDTTQNQAYQACMQLVLCEGLGDQRQARLSGRGTAIIHRLALYCLLNHDSTGETAYPVLLELLESTSVEAPGTRRFEYTNDGQPNRQDIRLWIDTFGALVDSTDMMDRHWLADNIPTEKYPEFDQELNEIAIRLAYDEIEYIADSAQWVMKKRDLDKLLIPEN